MMSHRQRVCNKHMFEFEPETYLTPARCVGQLTTLWDPLALTCDVVCVSTGWPLTSVPIVLLSRHKALVEHCVCGDRMEWRIGTVTVTHTFFCVRPRPEVPYST